MGGDVGYREFGKSTSRDNLSSEEGSNGEYAPKYENSDKDYSKKTGINVPPIEGDVETTEAIKKDVNSPVIEDSKKSEGVAKKIVAGNREEIKPVESKVNGGGSIGELSKWKVLVIVVLGVILLLIGLYFIMVFPNSDKEDLNINLSTEYRPISDSNTTDNSSLLTKEPSQDFDFNILNLSCSISQITLSTELVKGSLDSVLFRIYYGNGSAEMVDASPISEGQIKDFVITLDDLDVAPWKVDISGVKDGERYSTMDSRTC